MLWHSDEFLLLALDCQLVDEDDFTDLTLPPTKYTGRIGLHGKGDIFITQSLLYS